MEYCYHTVQYTPHCYSKYIEVRAHAIQPQTLIIQEFSTPASLWAKSNKPNFVQLINKAWKTYDRKGFLALICYLNSTSNIQVGSYYDITCDQIAIV